ncbi:electron transfer flavoprotein subunit alpha/FixB family protein [Desulfuromonas sp. AOP6]|uniref:electron transfer flavoprotein subunit alpha/FixB family protein n=1 Tax=Desulfuromonas sp. AOP6 TaxID=1566351 RepID=UPI00126B6857|nr:electron transfer flavoprotein subunit alpha/FixB family protein [Desulfuromonas sp. AOP6]BCA79089.1 electron transfer flavoprotein subunit alpha [Desulfuromonas sp. AOP6]
MKALLIAEYRDGNLLGSTYELLAFADKLGAETVMFQAGSEQVQPAYDGTLYLADVADCGEYNPAGHRDLILSVVEKEKPDLVVFSHSSYGWDLAPRVALALQAPQISEVVEIGEDGGYVVPACNAKLRRRLAGDAPVTVLTLQAGAFNPQGPPAGTPRLEKLTATTPTSLEFLGYEAAEKAEVDLAKAEVIVSAGRGIGKPETMEIIAALAEALGGEYAASRPVVDAGWADHSRQVGTTGQTVAPKLYVACGISGAIQHLAGMKKSGFIVAINTDKDAPIGEVADVLVVADLKQFVPALTAKIKG